MGEKIEKPRLTEDEIRLMMELYNLSKADEPSLREWLGYNDINLTKEAAAKLSEIKKQFDSGLLSRKLLEDGKKNISNSYDKGLDKKCRLLISKTLIPFLLTGVLACFVLWIMGILSFEDKRQTSFFIHQECQLIGIRENVNSRSPLLSVEIKIRDDPVFREITKEINASFVVVDYNVSIKEPIVSMMVFGERSGRGFIEIEGKRLPLRPSSIEWIAVITFRDKKQEEEWLIDIGKKFILK